MSELTPLLEYARKQETAERREELEKRVFPLWFFNYIASQITRTSSIPYDEFISEVLDGAAPHKSGEAKPSKSKEEQAADILAEFAPLIEADRERRAELG